MLYLQQIESSLRSSSKAEPSDAEIARLNAEKRLFGGQVGVCPRFLIESTNLKSWSEC